MKRAFALLLTACLLFSSVGGVAAASSAPASDSISTHAWAAANETQNETETGTETANNSTTGADSKPAQTEQQADLYVEQPRHVGSGVDRTVTESGVTYTVNGQVLELEPRNFDPENVIRGSVREDAATLKFDKSIGRYILDTQGTAGTYQVMFRTRADGQITTYRATIKVQQASYAHVAPTKLDALEDHAEQYDWVVSQFVDAGLLQEDVGADRVEAVIEDAVTWYTFYDNPLSGLSGQFLSFAIMLLKWPAGWVILGTIFIVAFWRLGKTKKENRKLKRQFADIENINESKREAQERELKRILSMQTFQDLGLTDTDAQAVKEHCDVDNPRQFLDKFRDYFAPSRSVVLLLSAYEQLGHAVSVTRRDGRVVEAELVEQAAVPDGGVAADSAGSSPGMGGHIRPSDADQEIIDALDWDELSPDVLWHDDVDASTLDMPVNNDAESEGTDLVEEFGIPIGEDGTQYHIVERREEFVDILVQIIEGIAASEFTDEEGRVRPDADLLDFLYTFSAVGAEGYRESLWDLKEILLRTRQKLDAGERMTDLAERSKNNELGPNRRTGAEEGGS
ncbi:hypothetical protein [Halolamina sp.]|uniref:hypothetical protein n=1 Tax=Halolamina sp. TaxID=1940283 RepID=UPI003567D537